MNELFARNFDSSEEDEDYVPDAKELLEEEKEIQTKEIKSDKNKIDALWNKLKSQNQITKKSTIGSISNFSTEKNIDVSNSNTKNNLETKIQEDKQLEKNINVDEEKNLIKEKDLEDYSEKELNMPLIEGNKDGKQSENYVYSNKDQEKNDIEDEIMEAIRKSKEISKTITKKVNFAGREYEYQKELTEKDLKLLRDKEKKKTHQGLDDLIDSLPKKKDISVVDKSKMDWKTFVDKKKLERELEFNRKDGFLSKKRFIDESNQRIIENQKSQIRKLTKTSSHQNK